MDEPLQFQRPYTGLLDQAGGPIRQSRVEVGYPVGGSVALPFHDSIMKMFAYEILKPSGERLLSRVMHTSGLYVADNRQLLVERFLESRGSDWLLQIDTDVSFPAAIIEKMVDLAGPRKILAASVPLGAWQTCAFMRTDSPGVWRALESVPADPIEVDGIATACVLIHREVFEEIANRNGHCWFHHTYLPASRQGTDPRDFRYTSQGEDLAFSARAKQAGFSIWVVTIPGVAHHKVEALSHDYGVSGSARYAATVAMMAEKGADAHGQPDHARA